MNRLTRDQMAERVARDIPEGAYVNLGIGLPTKVADYLPIDRDMFLQIQVREDQLLAFLPLIEQSRVRLFVDHCGRPAPERGLAQPGFQALLDLGRAGRASVKLSGFSQFSRDRYPFRDVWPFVHALTEAFGWDGCVWGSDWPFLRSPERNDYGLLLDLIADLVPEEANRRKLLWDTPARLFGFGG